MVAEREACSCRECGTLCKGKFAGCVDVWARGPRTTAASLRPTAEPLRRVRVAPTLDKVDPVGANREPTPPTGPGTGHRKGLNVTVVDELAAKVRKLEAAVAAAPRPSPQGARPADDSRVEAVAQAVAGIAAALERLTAEVKEIRAVPARVEALERRAVSSKATQAQASQAAGTKAVERLGADLAHLSVRIEDLSTAGGKARNEASAVREALQNMSSRLEQLDKDRARLMAAMPPIRPGAPGPGPDVVAAMQRSEQRLEQLAARVAPLDQRLEQLSARVPPLDQLAARVRALELAEPPAPAPDVAGQVRKLAAQVAALEARPKARGEDPGQKDRLDAMEKVLGALLQTVERVAGRVSGLDEVPKRLEALETAPAVAPPAEGPPVEKILVGMGKRLDRLSTQVGELKGLPERVRAIETDPGRTETLSRGLGGAIDMIDQLSAQVAAIEHSTHSGNGSPR